MYKYNVLSSPFHGGHNLCLLVLVLSYLYLLMCEAHREEVKIMILLNLDERTKNKLLSNFFFYKETNMKCIYVLITTKRNNGAVRFITKQPTN